eukprot:1155709-Pleurochrysis_carterae.AAC.1
MRAHFDPRSGSDEALSRRTRMPGVLISSQIAQHIVANTPGYTPPPIGNADPYTSTGNPLSARALASSFSRTPPPPVCAVPR